MKKWIRVEVDEDLKDDDIEVHLKLLKGIGELVIHDEGDHKEYHNEVLERVGRQLWQMRDRDNPGAIDDIVGEICEAIEKDLSNTPMTGRYDILTPKKESVFDAEPMMGTPDIGVWVTKETDVLDLGGALEKMRGVKTVETI
jgi:hypothetical protein